MTLEEKYMKAASERRKRLLLSMKCLLDASLFIRIRLLPEDITEGLLTRMYCPMQRLLPSAKRVKKWETGDWKTVPCMSLWSHAPCVLELLSKLGFQK